MAPIPVLDEPHWVACMCLLFIPMLNPAIWIHTGLISTAPCPCITGALGVTLLELYTFCGLYQTWEHLLFNMHFSFVLEVCPTCQDAAT